MWPWARWRCCGGSCNLGRGMHTADYLLRVAREGLLLAVLVSALLEFDQDPGRLEVHHRDQRLQQ